jgi:peptidyl-tRNA hydrolase
MPAKQVIIVRRDLEMPVGKFGSQVAHASLGAVQTSMKRVVERGGYEYSLFVADDTPMGEWWAQAETTIILGTHPKRGDHSQQLLDIQALAMAKDLPTKLVIDNGTTVFGGVKTVTCLGIGPGYLDDFIGLTDHLRPY